MLDDHDAARVEHCRCLAEERFGPTRAEIEDALTTPPVSLAEVLAAIRCGADISAYIDDLIAGLHSMRMLER